MFRHFKSKLHATTHLGSADRNELHHRVEHTHVPAKFWDKRRMLVKHDGKPHVKARHDCHGQALNCWVNVTDFGQVPLYIDHGGKHYVHMNTEQLGLIQNHVYLLRPTPEDFHKQWHRFGFHPAPPPPPAAPVVLTKAFDPAKV